VLLALEDLCAGYRQPCIIDIKVRRGRAALPPRPRAGCAPGRWMRTARLRRPAAAAAPRARPSLAEARSTCRRRRWACAPGTPGRPRSCRQSTGERCSCAWRLLPGSLIALRATWPAPHACPCQPGTGHRPGPGSLARIAAPTRLPRPLRPCGPPASQPPLPTTPGARCLRRSKDESTTQASLGFRICGLQVFRRREGRMRKEDRHWGKRLAAGDVAPALLDFADNGAHAEVPWPARLALLAARPARPLPASSCACRPKSASSPARPHAC
jgi:hypothetical protein